LTLALFLDREWEMDDASVDNAPFHQLPAVHHRAHALHSTPHRQGIETRRKGTLEVRRIKSGVCILNKATDDWASAV
jgi:hypothetical protein